ncbi:hypothetical protein BKA70DRAFT_44864 [Coprinopsis sp. MPI-PUGE-AT-0042]|nr:hypothetical protein BKA70DRAFT_44864 [Coprinopsis sp. MPI-PUGE-AT-0042]
MEGVPPEIFMSIFEWCAQWVHLKRSPRHSLAYTQVCRRWREVGLSAAVLWGDIDLSRPDMAMEWMQRSKGGPLYVYSSRGGPFHPKQLLHFPREHMHRVYSLDLFLFEDDMKTLLCSLGTSFPNLLRLTLETPSSTPPAILTSPPGSTALTHVILFRVAIPWDSLLGATSLVNLTIVNVGDNNFPPLSTLHAILRANETLEVIRLTSRSRIEGWKLELEKLNLPLLKSLDLTIPAHAIGIFFGTVEIPASCAIRLIPWNLVQLHDLCLPPRVSARPDIPSSVVRILPSSLQILRGGPEWSDSPNDLATSIVSSGSFGLSKLALGTSLGALGLITIMELASQSLRESSSEALQECLRGLPSLEILRVANNDLKTLLDVLSSPPYAHSTGALCPRLTTLAFGTWASLWYTFRDRWWQQIVDCTLRRRRMGALITTLRLIRCHGFNSKGTEEVHVHPNDPEDVLSHRLRSLEASSLPIRITPTYCSTEAQGTATPRGIVS